MAIITVPKPLRDKLGEDATDSLIELFREKDEEQKNHLFELVEERFERRILESEARIQENMNRGFMEVQKQFSEVHKGIANQTKWILTAILAGAVIYPIAVKLGDKLF